MGKDIPTDDETLDLYLLIGRTNDAMHMARRQKCAKLGITPQQAAVIHLIKDLGGEAKPTEISLWLFRKRHSIHSIIERMENAGILKKVRDTERKNGVKVILTKKGQTLCHRISKRESLKKIIGTLPHKKRMQLRSSLEILFAKAREEIGVNNNLPLRPILHV